MFWTPSLDSGSLCDQLGVRLSTEKNLRRRHLYDKSKMAALPGKKNIFTFFGAFTSSNPVGSDFIGKNFALQIVWMQNEQFVVN